MNKGKQVQSEPTKDFSRMDIKLHLIQIKEQVAWKEKDFDEKRKQYEMAYDELTELKSIIASINQETKIEKADHDDKCPICLSEERNTAFIICGHTGCSKCLKQLEKCPSCNIISEKIKIFL